MERIGRTILLFVLSVLAAFGSKRATDFTPLVAAVAKDFPSVPEDVVNRIIYGESGGNPDIVGKAGEIGLMQVLPKTAKFVSQEVLGRPKAHQINLRDPEENIRLGVGFLSWLVARYDGDIERAIAAYNCGPGCVDKLAGKPREHFFRKIPRSTKRYVSAILKLPAAPVATAVKSLVRTVHPPKPALSQIQIPAPPPLPATASQLKNPAPQNLLPESKASTIRHFNGVAAIVVGLEQGHTVSHLALKYTGNARNWSSDDIQVFVQGQLVAKAAYNRLPVGAEVVIAEGMLRVLATQSITVTA